MPRSLATPRRLALAVAALVASAAAARAETQTFVRYGYVDPMTRLEAFHLLVPKGWKVEGAITWSENPALPAQSRFRFHDPVRLVEFNLLPTRSYFWTTNPLFLTTNPPGSLRFGTRVAKPIDLHTALTRVVIAEARRGAGGLEIVREQPVPELAEIARGQAVRGVRSSAEAGKARVRYRESGAAVEEEFYAAVSHFVTDLPGSGLSPGYAIDYWFIDDVFSFRAAQGELDAHSKTFQTMLYSLKVNPRWFAKVVNVKEMLAQRAIRQVKAVGRIGEMVARAGSQLREEQLRDWQRRQDVNDRLVQDFTDHVRGVERFHDPFEGKDVELPAGYGMAWANNNGEYVVTDSPSYNPNVGSNLHWEPLQPAR